MTGLIPVDRLHSIGVVVRDLETATRRYAEVLGIDAWDVREYGPDRLSAARAHGRPVSPAFRTATGTTVAVEGIDMFGTPPSPVTFELVEPGRGESPFAEFRAVRGQGISHLTLAVLTPDAFDALADGLRRNGIGIAASFTVDDVLVRHFLDTRAALGFLTEVRVPLAGGSEPAVTRRWDRAGDHARPEGVGPIGVRSVGHFGVVVPDMMAGISRYANLLGVPAWNVRDWRTEPGLLEAPYYRGAPVEHGYFTGLSQVSDFGFEVIQPTYGDSHYNREFGDRFGSGVHHLLLTATADQGEWDRTTAWLAGAGMPQVQGADLLGGAGRFCYYDTSAALGGYLVEAAMLLGPPDPAVMAPDFVVDFAALTRTL